MMTRILVLVAIIAALMATTAYANQFSINGTDAGLADISSGSTDVHACSQDVSVDIIAAPWNGNSGDYPVRAIDVVTSPACAGHLLYVDLLAEDNSSIFRRRAEIGHDGTLRMPVGGSNSSGPILVGDVYGVAVLIDAY